MSPCEYIPRNPSPPHHLHRRRSLDPVSAPLLRTAALAEIPHAESPLQAQARKQASSARGLPWPTPDSRLIPAPGTTLPAGLIQLEDAKLDSLEELEELVATSRRSRLSFSCLIEQGSCLIDRSSRGSERASTEAGAHRAYDVDDHDHQLPPPLRRRAQAGRHLAVGPVSRACNTARPVIAPRHASIDAGGKSGVGQGAQSLAAAARGVYRDEIIL
ncbi:hypothetical protein T492DRAFT_1118758 [Pavlovales sp. CCMP2436]|nr:hypothetical protein T492DRAFT_1118758 [Pavlovales sp. CCMP2436]